MLSILIFLFPPLYGEGYDTINLLLNGVTLSLIHIWMDWKIVLMWITGLRKIQLIISRVPIGFMGLEKLDIPPL